MNTPSMHRYWRAAAGAALVLVGAALLAAGLAACGPKGPDSRQVILATTTSVKDSGLLDEAILPGFGRLHPELTIKTVAVGSGEALAMGERGDADVLLVHSPADEQEFMAAGHGARREPVAFNYFKIVGPADDPAVVRDVVSAAEAFARIARDGATFVSRGDESGTNKKELAIWAAAGVVGEAGGPPQGDWYVVSGQGQGETLQIASQKGAYTLTDEATFLTMRGSLELEVLFGQSDDLRNQYSVIVVDSDEHQRVNAGGAALLADYLTGPEGQRAIGQYGRAEFGHSLFVPDADGVVP